MEIWTDGSCHPNPGRGGWGWRRSDGRSGCGGERLTTNNKMELTAILMALRELADGTEATVYSDSQYCVHGLTIWSEDWRKREWRKKGEPMPNRDLWLALEAQKARLKIDFRWVRGHNGDPGNEHADRLAALGASKVDA